MADSQAGEKTERATPRRREKALEQGQVALSQEVNSILVLLAGFSLIFLTAGYIAENLNENARYLFSQAHTLMLGNPGTIGLITSANMTMVLKAIAPFLGVIMVSGILANLLQVGWHVNVSAMNFRVENINPVKGMQSIFSKKALFELLKNIMKIAVISLVAWMTIRRLDLDIMATALLSLDGVTAMGRSAMMQLVYKLVAALAVIAVADWIFQKYQYEQNIKMTKQELKEEYKDMEGDPQIKARIRSIQYEMARRRMMADVPRADVVITNPTHFAVAIKYTTGDAAPIVLAKGTDDVAQKIKLIARNAHVPVIENKPLARGLHKAVKIGGMIPDEFFKAVAEVLAYVYRLRKA